MPSTLVKPPQSLHRPFQLILIASFQFLKAGFLLTVAAIAWLAPNTLPHTTAFSQMFYIAAHGRSPSGVLIPIFGLYVAYVGVGLLRLRRRIRRNLAISSVFTICLSLWRLGVFGESNLTSQFDRQTLYILVLLDLAVYLYLAFHPEVTRSFKEGY